MWNKRDEFYRLKRNTPTEIQLVMSRIPRLRRGRFGRLFLCYLRSQLGEKSLEEVVETPT